jgi:hypothetical protein
VGRGRRGRRMRSEWVDKESGLGGWCVCAHLVRFWGFFTLLLCIFTVV